jgi:phenol 2-monooxygenase
MKEAATFSTGLSIGYPVDDLLNIQGSLDCGQESMPRQRVPDVPLQKLGTLEAIRMHNVTPNIGVFYVVAFVGHTAVTQTSLKSFANALTNSSFLNQTWLQFLIIAKTIGSSAYELLGIDPSFARVFYDKTGEAHARYGVNTTKGAIYVFRPDGWIGTALPSGEAAVEGLERYFQKFMIF